MIDLFCVETQAANEYVQSQRRLLLGMAYNNLSQFTKAKQMYSAAAQGFTQKFSTHFYFISRINLFWVHYNQKNRHKMELELAEIQKCSIDSEGEALRVLSCKLSFSLSIENFDACDETILEIENKSSSMSEAFKINFLIDKFNLELKRSNFELCQQYLHDMKKYRKYYLTSNYNFMKTLLDHYLKNTPIYVNDRDFKDSPYLLLQLKVIQKLRKGI